MLAVSTGVFMRYFIGIPLTWAIDVSAILLLYVTFLAAPWLLREDGHVKMDLLVSRLNPRYQSFLNIFTSIIGLIIFATITWYGAKSTWIHYETGFWMPTALETPKYLILVIIPAGSCLVFIQFIRRTHRLLRNVRSTPGQ